MRGRWSRGTSTNQLSAGAAGARGPDGRRDAAEVSLGLADGEDLNEARIHDVMTTRPTVINPATSITDVAKIMTHGHFRHLAVTVNTSLVGIVDIADVCRALIDPGPQEPPTTLAESGARWR